MKILFCSDSLNHVTGMGHVILNIINGLNKEYKDLEIVYCTFTGHPTNREDYIYHGVEYKSLFDKMDFEYISPMDANKQDIFDKVISYHKPDLVFSFVDAWLLEPIAYSDYRENYKWITYLTFEVNDYPIWCYFPCFKYKQARINIKELLSRADINIPVAKIGENNLKNFDVKYCDNVYHGLDVEILNSIENKDKLKKSDVFGEAVKDNDFLFMTLGKNTERKRIDFVIDAFHKFLMAKEEKEREFYKLYIHSNINETYDSGTDLLTMITSLGITKNIVVPDCYRKNEELSKVELYKRYLVSDCYVSLSVGEGFGLGAIDALLCGKPLIYSRDTVVEEIGKRCGLPVNTIESVPARNNFINFKYPSIRLASTMMQSMEDIIKDNSGIYKDFIKRCNESTKDLTWKNCVNKIKVQIDDVMKNSKKVKYFLRKV